MLLNLASTTSFLVGIVFLFTGIAKVIEPWKFIGHIAQLGLLKRTLTAPTSITFIAIESALGMTAEKNMLPIQPGDVPATFADVDDLVADVGFKPETSIESGISKFVDWYKAYFAV